ncbi:MAG: DUF6702 family protein [Sphingobacteriaceae bacterium]
MMLQLFIYLIGFLHPYYVSVTEIKHNAQVQSLEISCRINADDLENALKKLNKEKLDILNAKSKAQVNGLLPKYIPQHLKITVNGKTTGLVYLGYEIESEAIWCYFEAKGVKTVKSISIQNDLLFAEHPEQINMMHVSVKGERKSTKLDNPQSKADFSF